MGVVTVLAVQTALRRLFETYEAPVDRDYWVY
jgi:hypothetical protein